MKAKGKVLYHYVPNAGASNLYRKCHSVSDHLKHLFNFWENVLIKTKEKAKDVSLFFLQSLKQMYCVLFCCVVLFLFFLKYLLMTN